MKSRLNLNSDHRLPSDERIIKIMKKEVPEPVQKKSRVHIWKLYRATLFRRVGMSARIVLG